MKYTKEQRREIYLEAAEMIFLNAGAMNQDSFSCFAFAKLLGIDYEETLQYLPEFVLFDTNTYKDATNIYWTYDRYQERTIALLLCAEMCRP